jgi:ubiquinone/menaquinone biosynthesis C-methylase UbiE
MDPAGKEIRALQRMVEWKGKRVLEIGCGEGRLTLRLAAFRPRHIEAMDPDQTKVQTARKNLPEKYRKLIRYHVAHAERLRYPREQFDIVIFAWAL